MGEGGRIHRRLAWYWPLELANALLVPGMFAFFAVRHGGGLGWPGLLALVPVAGLLVVGGLYWRGKLHALRGKRAALDAALALADRWDRPLLILSVIAAGLAVAGALVTLPGSTAADRWAVPLAALLAAAEYVNYYHRQLQHFDNLPDFQRLLKGQGLRPAKLAVDLAAWRKARGAREAA